MTVPVDDRRYEYPGNGTADTFAGPRLFSASHLQVFLIDDATGSATVLSEGAGYTVSGVGGAGASSVVLTTPHAAGTTLLLLRTVPYAQDTAFRNLGKFFPEIHEDAFDKVVQMIQQVADLLERAPAFAETILAGGVSLAMPAPVPNAYWRWSADGLSITYDLEVDLGTGVVASAFGASLVEVANSDGAKPILELGMFAGNWNSLPANTILGRTGGDGAVEQIPCAAVGRTFLSATTQPLQRSALGLGTMATQAASSVAITGGSAQSLRVSELTQEIIHNASGALAIDLALGHYVVLNQSANITDVTFSNVPAGQAVTVSIERVKDNSGTARTIAWPAAVLFPGGVDPTLTQTANGRDLITLVTRDGGTSFVGTGAAGFA